MPSRLVILGAPTRSDIYNTNTNSSSTSSSYKWTRIALPIAPARSNTDADAILPPATLDAANTRLSEIYRGVIFGDSLYEGQDGPEGQEMRMERESSESVEIVLGPTDGDSTTTTSHSKNTTDVSRLLTDWSKSANNTRSSRRLSADASTSRLRNPNTNTSGSYQYTYTESSLNDDTRDSSGSGSSIARFPTFHVNPHLLSSLAQLQARALGTGRRKPANTSVSVLVGVLEVTGPDCVRLRRGREAGKEVGVLRLVVGDEEGRVAQVTAWRECADRWGGGWQEGARDGEWERLGDGEPVRKGDTVLLENLSLSAPAPAPSTGPNPGAHTPLALTASPFQRSRLTICYRSLPQVARDSLFRPDLRLAASDVGVEKVKRVVQWVERMAGVAR